MIMKKINSKNPYQITKICHKISLKIINNFQIKKIKKIQKVKNLKISKSILINNRGLVFKTKFR